MISKRSFLLVLAAIFGVGLNSYLIVYAFCGDTWTHYFKSMIGNESKTDAEQSAKTNPNKMLFISCGGFLE